MKLLLTKKGVDVYVTGGSKYQTAVHMVASRQTGTATSILRALLGAAGKEIRLRTDAVSTDLRKAVENLSRVEPLLVVSRNFNIIHQGQIVSLRKLIGNSVHDTGNLRVVPLTCNAGQISAATV